MLAVPADVVNPLVQSGHKLVEINANGKTEAALVREVQWDAFSRSITHIDFMRIDANERVHVVVPVSLRGTAAGIMTGGVLEQPVHSLHLDCLAVDVPDAIIVKIDHLKLGEAIHVRDLVDLPTGATIKAQPDQIIVHVIAPRAVEIATPDPSAAPTQPEVVGKKKKEGEEAAASK